jgi:hypothetical protein
MDNRTSPGFARLGSMALRGAGPHHGTAIGGLAAHQRGGPVEGVVVHDPDLPAAPGHPRSRWRGRPAALRRRPFRELRGSGGVRAAGASRLRGRKGIPERSYRGDIVLRPAGGGTAIAWTASLEPLIPGTGVLVLACTRGYARLFARELVRYADRLAEMSAAKSQLGVRASGQDCSGPPEKRRGFPGLTAAPTAGARPVLTICNQRLPATGLPATRPASSTRCSKRQVTKEGK